MRDSSVTQLEESRRLRSAYDRAWEQWLQATTTWQGLQEGPTANSEDLAEAEMARRLAYAQYQQARNRLAEFLLSNAHCIPSEQRLQQTSLPDTVLVDFARESVATLG
jgi:hypothetical protein